MLRHSVWAHDEGGHAVYISIERGQIRDTLSGSITVREFMLEQRGLRGDTADATPTNEFREGNE